MERYVLFSPIGGTDPMAEDRITKEIRDAAMLHIVRKYHPEYIRLFLSAEKVMEEEKDHRFTDCIRSLKELCHFEPEVDVISRPELRDVHRFDYFYEEFPKHLNDLHQRFPRHTILVNVTSGTPAMQSALYVLGFTLPYPVLSVQVSTPAKRENKPKLEYDKEYFWECNLDNIPERYKDRCTAQNYTNLQVQIAGQIIKSHLNAFDYEAALRTAEKIRGHMRDDTLKLLDAARNRILLNWKGIPTAIQRRFGLHPETDSEERIQLSEYLLWLQMKQKRGDLGDFVRGLTPALFALLRIAVEENGNVPISEYCTDGDRITRDSLERDERGRTFLAFFPWDFQYGFLQTSNYDAAIEQLFKDRPWAAPLQELRSIEGTMRNLVAHTITRVDDAGLKKLQRGPVKVRKNSGEIMELIRQSVSGINMDEKDASGEDIRINWDSYEIMNRKILESMNRSALAE